MAPSTKAATSVDSFWLIIPMGCLRLPSGSCPQKLFMPWIRSHFVTRTYTGNLTPRTRIISSMRRRMVRPSSSSASGPAPTSLSAATVTMRPLRGSLLAVLDQQGDELLPLFLVRLPVDGDRVPAGRVDDDGVLEEPPVAVPGPRYARRAPGIGKGRRELGAAQGGRLPGAALADDEVPRQDVQGVALFFQVGLAEGVDGLLPPVLQFFLVVSLLVAHCLHARLVLREHVLDKPLLAAPGPDLPEGDPPDDEARDEQQQEQGHPHGPPHQQDKPEHQQDDEDDDRGRQEELQYFQDALFHQFDTARRKFSPTWSRMK